MISELFLKDYFKGLCETSKDIAHRADRQSFYKMRDAYDLDEFDNALRSMANERCVILTTGEGSFGSSDNIQDKPKVSLYFVIKFDGSFEKLDQIRNDAKLIAEKFIAKMKYDLLSKFERPDQQDGPLKVNKVKFDCSGNYRDLGTLDDGTWSGKMLDIEFSGSGVTNTVFNPNDWEDLD